MREVVKSRKKFRKRDDSTNLMSMMEKLKSKAVTTTAANAPGGLYDLDDNKDPADADAELREHLERNRKEAEMKHNQVCWLKLH
jgi:hypothetical protein